MEVALYVPPTDWCLNTPDNDLSHWGLDYRPLSAYASWLAGRMLHAVDPKAVTLFSSRGYETATSRAAMRTTVLVADALVFIPALLFAVLSLHASGTRRVTPTLMGAEALSTVIFCMLLPSLVLVDHGHFQYNGVSLGLFLGALGCFAHERDSLAAALFCGSIYFKHMGLYYALAVFAYLVSKMLHICRRVSVLAACCYAASITNSIAITTAVSFWPWIGEPRLLLHVLRRLFPVARGLYEDKVANVWCSLSVLIKLNRMLSNDQLFSLCAAVTAIASLPFCAAVAFKPTMNRLLLATAGCSLAAFLFSYQVHEKQILLPLMPIALLHGRYWYLTMWASLTAASTLFPLLHREGLTVAYIAVVAMHIALLFVQEKDCILQPSHASPFSRMASSPYKCLRVFSILGLAVGFILHIILVTFPPPNWAPDIFVLLLTSYGCAHFCLIYIALLVEVWSSSEPGAC